MQHLNASISKIDQFLVLKRHEWQLDSCGFMQTVICLSFLCESGSSGSMVRVDMRVDHMRNRHALRRGKSYVSVDISVVGIYDSAFAQRAASKDIRCTASFKIVVGTEDHMLDSTGRPAAFHSGNPSSNRRARLP